MAELVQITVTEALAELKTIDKRIEKKREFILQYLARQDAVKDPLERDGGSFACIRSARQAMKDLEERKVKIRREIQRVNAETTITVNGTGRSVADWLVWRREVAPFRKDTLDRMIGKIQAWRKDAHGRGFKVVEPGANADSLTDLVINLNEKELTDEMEEMEEILGRLDGQLSLKNATTTITL